MKKKPRKTTLAETAKRLGVTRQLLSLHRKKPGAPPAGDVLAWAEFLALHGREGSAPPELRRKIAEQRLALLSSMAEREAIRLAKDRGETVPKDEISGVIRKALAMLFDGLDRIFINELPASIAGLSPEAIAILCRDHIAKLRNDLRTQFRGMIEEES